MVPGGYGEPHRQGTIITHVLPARNPAAQSRPGRLAAGGVVVPDLIMGHSGKQQIFADL